MDSFLSYALQLPGANLFTLLLAFSQLLSGHHGGVAASAGSQFGSSHSHLESRSR